MKRGELQVRQRTNGPAVPPVRLNEQDAQLATRPERFEEVVHLCPPGRGLPKDRYRFPKGNIRRGADGGVVIFQQLLGFG